MSDPANRPIGIFDSGIGGLTVLREVFRLLPWEDTLYLGDMARVPYGTKSPETVTRYAFENTRFLLNASVKMIVVACNTASAVGLSALQQAFPVPIIGVLEPGARAATRQTENKKIGVIGTEVTIRSQAYSKAIEKIRPDVEIIAAACPLFVPLVEEGWIRDEIAFQVADRYLSPLKAHHVDTLVLGCTHYPLLKPVIRRVMGEEVNLIDSAEETALEVMKQLEERRLLHHHARQSLRQYFVTDAPSRFEEMGKRFLGEALTSVEKVDLS
ncbi:MAG: glutamate racemase [Nitrospirae bacterium]|nr:glutamate racemase [Nitrospirota bacterium]